jgi:hypothetical protein
VVVSSGGWTVRIHIRLLAEGDGRGAGLMGQQDIRRISFDNAPGVQRCCGGRRVRGCEAKA